MAMMQHVKNIAVLALQLWFFGNDVVAVYFLQCCGYVIVFVIGVLNVVFGSISIVVQQRVFGEMLLHLAGHCGFVVSTVVFGGSTILMV